MAEPTPSQTVKLNVLPTPGSLSSQMRPPINSTSLRRDREAEAGAAMFARRGHVRLGERLEQFRRLLARHADAGVAHGELELHFLAGAFEQIDVQADLAALGELDGVVDEVGQDLTEAKRVAEQLLGNRGSDMGQELEPLIVRLLGRERGDRADHLVELEIGGLDVELVGLDLREIEDVVDDAEQRRAGVVDLAHVVALLGIERRLEGEVRETDDGVHRRADLVAHVGQERALGLGGVLGFLHGQTEFRLQAA